MSPTPGKVLFGQAVSISYFPTCNASLDSERYNFARLFYEAAGDDPVGKLLVLAGNGHPDVSLAGGTKLSRVQNLASQEFWPMGGSGTSTFWLDTTSPRTAGEKRHGGVATW